MISASICRLHRVYATLILSHEGFITTPLRGVFIVSVRRQLHPVGRDRWSWHFEIRLPDGIVVGGGTGCPVRFDFATANSVRFVRFSLLVE